MTPPEPARAPVADPDYRAHADLLVDLSRAMTLRDGLSRILNIPPVDLLAIDGFREAAEPHGAAHARLVADLQTALGSHNRPGHLLSLEGGHASLITDLRATIDTTRGRLAIIEAPKPLPEAASDAGEPAAAASASTLPPSTGPTVIDNLWTIYAAPAHQRLLLRFGAVHRELRNARDALAGIRTHLVEITPSPDQRDTTLATVPAELSRQHDLVAGITTTLARALPRRPEPHCEPTGTETPEAGSQWWAATGQADEGPAARPEATVVAFSPDGRTFAIGDHEGRIRLWDATTVRPTTAPWDGRHGGVVTAAAISPDGLRLITGGRDGIIRIWDTTAGESPVPMSLDAHLGRPTTAVTFALDGRMATADSSGGVLVWNPRTGEGITEWKPDGIAVASMAFSSAGDLLATVDSLGQVRLRDTASGQNVGAAPLGKDVGIATVVAFSPDGNLLAVATADGEVLFWNRVTGEQRMRRTSDPRSRRHNPRRATDCMRITAAAFSPRGEVLATVNADADILLWAPASAQTVGAAMYNEQGNREEVTALGFGSDGSLMASTASTKIYRWRSVYGDFRERGDPLILLKPTRFVPQDAIQPAGIDTEPPGIDHRTLAAVAPLVHQAAKGLTRLLRRLEGGPHVADHALLRRCSAMADRLANTMQQVWEALSDFQGADLHAAGLLRPWEDLDGVRWSDGTSAAMRATRWPPLHQAAVEACSRIVGPGVFEIQVGASVRSGC